MPARLIIADGERLLTMKEVADKLRISLRAVERFRADGQLEIIHLGRNIRITEWSLQRFVAARVER